MADIKWTTEHVRRLVISWHGGLVENPPSTYPGDSFDAWLAAHDAEVAREAVAKMLKTATEALEALTKPTEHGRYAEAGYNDHFNDGLSAAVEAIENTLQGEEEA